VQRIKPRRHAPHGTLLLLPIPDRPWQDIYLDFVVGLPESDRFDAIWVVVDRLSKQHHFVPCTSTITAEGLARLFLDHVFKLHGLPDSIISDRGPQFASHFWTYLCCCLGIQPRLSTAFHPQIDGQTERIIGSMEEYLRRYVNYLQDDWVRMLAIAEFAGNNQVSAATGASPFYATAGCDPKTSYELDIRVDNPDEARVLEVAMHMVDIHDFLRAHMRYAQAKYIENANAHRLPAPVFQPGDMVFLDTRNMHTICLSRKLDDKNASPFRVIHPVGSHAYELDLPAEMELWTGVFHTTLLELVQMDLLPGQINPPHHLLSSEAMRSGLSRRSFIPAGIVVVSSTALAGAAMPSAHGSHGTTSGTLSSYRSSTTGIRGSRDLCRKTPLHSGAPGWIWMLELRTSSAARRGILSWYELGFTGCHSNLGCRVIGN